MNEDLVEYKPVVRTNVWNITNAMKPLLREVTFEMYEETKEHAQLLFQEMGDMTPVNFIISAKAVEVLKVLWANEQFSELMQ